MIAGEGLFSLFFCLPDAAILIAGGTISIRSSELEDEVAAQERNWCRGQSNQLLGSAQPGSVNRVPAKPDKATSPACLTKIYRASLINYFIYMNKKNGAQFNLVHFLSDRYCYIRGSRLKFCFGVSHLREP